MINVRACAKINLSLRVLGVRADGYHELRTVFQSIELHDTLTFRVEQGPLRLVCSDPACPADRTNLVWRAAECVWKAARRRGDPRGVSIRIEKRIPLRAGMGGGSSDAAAALRVLASLWRVSPARLPDMAASLGADVPYFLEGGTVLGLERGDLLFPLVDIPSSWVTLVIPSFGVSTQEAYGWFDQAVTVFSYSRGAPPPLADTLAPLITARGAPPPLASLAHSRSLEPRALRSRVSRTERHRLVPPSELCNDLEQPVAARHPDIAEIVAALGRAGATYAAMSGSGSAVFGLFDRRPSAERAARAIARRDKTALVTRTVGRAAYRRLTRGRLERTA